MSSYIGTHRLRAGTPQRVGGPLVTLILILATVLLATVWATDTALGAQVGASGAVGLIVLTVLGTYRRGTQWS